MLDAGQADLGLLGLDHDLRRVVDDHVGGEVGAGIRQRVGKLGADAGRRRVRVDGVRRNAETVLGDDGIEALVQRGIIDQGDAGAVGRNRFAPHLAPFETVGEHAQRIGPVRDRLRQQESIEGRGNGSRRQGSAESLLSVLPSSASARVSATLASFSHAAGSL